MLTPTANEIKMGPIAQETIAKTLTPSYLRSKVVLLPDQLNLPILINPGLDQPQQHVVGESEEL